MTYGLFRVAFGLSACRITVPRLPVFALALWVCIAPQPHVASGQSPPPAPQVPAQTRPTTQGQPRGYIGVAVTDIADGHTVFSWFLPGPFEGSGLGSEKLDMHRPDLLVAVDGQPMNAERFKQYIGSRAPGSTVTIEYRRSNARGATIPDAINHEVQVRKITVTVEPAEVWRGTEGRPRRSPLEVSFAGEALLNPDDANNVLGSAVAEHKLAEPLAKLRAAFVTFRDRTSDAHQLSRVRAGFAHPFRLPELEQIITGPTHTAPADPFAVAARMIRENLDAAPSTPVTVRPWTRQASTPQETAAMSALHAASQHLKAALPKIEDERAFATQCAALLRVPRETFYIAGPETKTHLAVMRRSEELNVEHLAAALEALAPLGALTPQGLEKLEARDPPPSLRGVVEGKVLAAGKGPDGWVVVGSAAKNRYDLAKLAAVIDVGGDDEYYAGDVRFGVQAVIDFAGNDRYSGTPDQGPASAILGVTLIDDRAGDDRYEGKLLSAGAAMYGAALLIDRAGNDTYAGSDWSMGAAMYGAGLLFDFGGGADTYLGEFLCQGAGGPLGLGVIVDDGGRDLYRANGPQPSSYETPAVYSSYSQGIGFGYRGYAAGGVGLLSDLGGDDRYEAGEFAQGGAYYYALGILHDAGGRDLYYGNRYAQGWGGHQAFGILADDAGNDTYWSMTAASQGAAWDVSAGLLIDRGGDDSYQADGLAQGGAAEQGIALLIDLDGHDRYDAVANAASQGQSGPNEYHFHATGALSFSLLLDLGGKADVYTAGRANSATTATGTANESDPKLSDLHGLVIDR